MDNLPEVKLVGTVAHVLHGALAGFHNGDLPSAATDEQRDVLAASQHASADLSDAEAAIGEKRAAIAAADARLYAAARAMHLQPVEYGEEGSRGGGGGFAPRGPRGVPLVSGDAVMRGVEEQRLVRTGNLRLGTAPPDFLASAGEPSYLAATSSGEARAAAQMERMVTTVGGWGPKFHATGNFSAADLPAAHMGGSRRGAAPAARLRATHSEEAAFTAEAAAAQRGASPRRGVSFGGGETEPVEKQRQPLPPAAVAGGATMRRKQPVLRQARRGGGSGGGGDGGDEFDAELSRTLDGAYDPYATAGEEGAPRPVAFSRAPLAPLPAEAVTGVRGEGLPGSLARAGALEASRRAGPGGKGGLSLDAAAANAAVADRLARPMAFLLNPRHAKPPSEGTLLTTGAGRRLTGGGGAGAPAPAGEGEGFLAAPSGGEGAPGPREFLSTGLHASLSARPVPALASHGPPSPAALSKREGLAGASQAAAGPFLVTPAALVWADYEAGDSRAQTLTLRNVDSLSRHVRVLPPATTLFRVDAPLWPGASGAGSTSSGPGVVGLAMPPGGATSAVAPGMVVRLTVTFTAPLGEPVEDALTLVTEGGTFTIPLRGTVPSPQLSLPPVIRCEPALLFDTRSFVLPVENVGSRGSFRLISEAALGGAPAGAGWEGDLGGGRGPHPADGRLPLGPFALWPDTLSLGKGERGEVHVLFSPAAAGFCRAEFAVVASGGGVFHYAVEGVAGEPLVALTSVGATEVPAPEWAGEALLSPEDAADAAFAPPPPPDDSRPEALLVALAAAVGAALGGAGAPPPPPLPPPTCPHPAGIPYRIRFEDLYPGTAQSRTVSVSNRSPCALRFAWGVEAWRRAPPRLALPEGFSYAVGALDGRGGEEDELPHARPAFAVEPAAGFLPPESTTLFHVFFSPPAPTGEAGEDGDAQPTPYDALASLLVQDVPRNPAAVEAEARAALARKAAAAAGRALRRTAGAGVYDPAADGSACDGEAPDVVLHDLAAGAVAAALDAARGVMDAASAGGGGGRRGGPTPHQVLYRDLPLVRLLCHGVSRPMDVVCLPPVATAATADGKPLLPGSTGWASTELFNRGDGHIVFALPTGANGLTPLPPCGVIPARSSALVRFAYTPPLTAPPGAVALDCSAHFFHASAFPQLAAVAPSVAAALLARDGGGDGDGDVCAALAVAAGGAALPPPAARVTLRVSAEVAAPWVVISSPTAFDLGLVTCASRALHKLTVRNPTTAPAHWALHCLRGPEERADAPGAVPEEEGGEAVEAGGAPPPQQPSGWAPFDAAELPPDFSFSTTNVVFSPPAGSLPPGGEAEVEVHVLAGTAPQRLRRVIRALTVPAVGPEEEEARPESAGALLSARPPGGEGSGEGAPLLPPPRLRPLGTFSRLPPALQPPPSFLSLWAQVQAPALTLSPPSLSLGLVFLHVPSVHRVTLANRSFLPAAWKFSPYVGALPPDPPGSRVSTPPKVGPRARRRPMAPSPFELSADVTAGVLPPRAEVTLTLTITPRRVGDVSGALAAVDVEGMAGPLGLSISLLARGVTLAYALVDDATGLVVPAPGGGGGREHPHNAEFGAQLDCVDGPLREKGDFMALAGAFAAARAAGATVGAAPPLRFSGARAPEVWAVAEGAQPEYPPPAPLVLNAEASFSLHVFNLSGISTRLGASFAELPPPPAEADTPWPQLFAGARASAAALAAAASHKDTNPPLPTAAQLAHAAFTRARRVDAWGLQRGGGGGSGGGAAPPPQPYSATAAAPRTLLSDAHEHTFRFASPAGRALVAAQDARSVQLRALARARGAALLVHPPVLELPPFSHAVLYVGALADMPGSYADTLALGPHRPPRSRGEPRAPRPAPGSLPPALSLPAALRAEGNPLRFVPGTSGLSCKGVGSVPVAENGFAAAPPPAGARGAVLSFGDLPSNAGPLARSVTIENSSPMDATITWHVTHDRAPHCAADALALAIEVDGEGGGGGEGGEDNVDGGADGGSSLSVTLRPATDRAIGGDVPLSFSLDAPVLHVPARGSARVAITAAPRPLAPEDVALATTLGWDKEDATGAAMAFLRARLCGDALFTPPGVAPPEALLLRAALPQTPAEGATRPPLAPEGGGDANEAPPLLPCDLPFVVRDALTLHTAVRPFTPQLMLNKGHLDGDGNAVVKFGVWSTAVAGGGGGGAAGSALTAARRQAAAAPPHPSCVQEITLTNAAGADAVFSLSTEGPFSLLRVLNAAPVHPSARGGAVGEGGGGGGGRGAAPPPPQQLHFLPPQANLTVWVAFNPAAGAGLASTAAAVLLGGTAGAAAAVAAAPPGALTLTGSLRGPGGAGGARGGGPAPPAPPDAAAPAPGGTITLDGSLGAAGVTAVPAPAAVAAVMEASLARLRGHYAGALAVRFAGAGDSLQRVSLLAEVLRPSIAVVPAVLAFGVLRASAGGPAAGGGARVLQLHLTNATTVPAAWAIRHVPAPPPGGAAAPAARAAAAATATGYLPAVQLLLDGGDAGGGSGAEGGGALPWRALGLPPDPVWARAPAPAPPEDDPSVFSFAALSGTVAGPTGPLAGAPAAALRASPGLPAPATLDVRFAPKAAVVYASRFRFAVAHGEAFEVVLTGRGTFEEV
jgi:hypothetical protein